MTNDANGINWIKIGDTTKDGKYIDSVKEKIRPEGVKKSRLVHKGDFLLTNSMSFGRPYILNVDGCIHDGWLVISPIGKAYTSDFLYYLLSSSFAFEQFTNVASGGVVTNLNSDKVADTIFPLPPYDEQKRIVSEIERCFALIDVIEYKKRDLRVIIKQAKSKILDLAIHGKLIPQEPNDEPASELLKRINPKAEITCDNPRYGKLPKSWVWAAIGNIGEVITGSTPSKDNKEYYGGNIPFFKPNDLEVGYNINSSKDKLSIVGFNASRKLPAYSVLVTCIGATIGKTGIISVEGTCNQQINAIIPSKIITPYYLYYSCISEYVQREIKSNASATTLPILNKSNFSKIAFPVPPLAEQHRIVVKIEELFAQLDKIEASL